MFSPIEPLIESLSHRLEQPLPGDNAHRLTRVQTETPFTFPNTIEQAVPAAVLILLFPEKDDIHFFLTERTEDVEHHKGQISLPGGVWEAGEQLHETALRETEEEIGVDQRSIQLMGGLTPFFTPVTGFLIHPFISWCQTKPQTNIQDLEVNQLFSPSLATLVDEATFQSEKWTIRGYDTIVPFFNFYGRKVWGATGAILSEFKSILKEII